VTFTTVGFGEMWPLGAIRFLCAVEALAGFVLITWSAAFTYLEMQRFWRSEAMK
jgi:Ion channel